MRRQSTLQGTIEQHSKRSLAAAGLGTVAIVMWVLLRPPQDHPAGWYFLAAVLIVMATAIVGSCGWLTSKALRTISSHHATTAALRREILAANATLLREILDIEIERVRRDHRTAEMVTAAVREEVEAANLITKRLHQDLRRETASSLAHFDKRVAQAVEAVRNVQPAKQFESLAASVKTLVADQEEMSEELTQIQSGVPRLPRPKRPTGQ